MLVERSSKWVCEIDGQEVDIIAANFSNMACVVPAGKHIVVYRYNKAAELFGFVFTFITLLIVLVSIIIKYFSHKRKLV